MKNKILLMGLLASTIVVSACTHRKVDVVQMEDKNKSCTSIEQEISDLKELENNIDDKTGMSGRNVGMALLFWPGVIVNEMNASDARERAADRREHLMKLYDKKNCN